MNNKGLYMRGIKRYFNKMFKKMTPKTLIPTEHTGMSNNLQSRR